MTSRSGTAAPTSILKPSTSVPATARSRGRQTAASGQTRGQTRGQTARDGDDDDDEGQTLYTAGSRRSNQTQGTKKPVSLFDVVNAAQEQGRDDDDGDVKADDIWNKFVSDQDDVRAPTAESRITGSQLSQRTGDSQGTGTGSQRPSQIDEEEEEESSEDDDRTIYSDYYLPPEYVRGDGTPEIRAEITDSHEACSCFPDRSSRKLGSMLYDKITCIHTGLQGHTQPGVFKFNPYWNESMEAPRRMRKRDMRISKSKFVFGYPRPKFELVFDSSDEEVEGDGEDDDEDGESDDDDDSGKPETPKTARTAKTRGSEDDDDEYDSEEFDDDDESDSDYIPFQLPQIGYPYTPSLPPSSHRSFRSRNSDFNDSIPELPSLPGSRQLTAQTSQSRRTQRTAKTQFTLPASQQTKRTGAKTAKSKSKTPRKTPGKDATVASADRQSIRTTSSRQSLPTGPVISTTRTFQGKVFDPVTKQVMLFDIGSRPGNRLPAGNIEPLQKPKPIETPRAGSKPGTSDSKKSKANEQSDVPKDTVASQHSDVPKAAVVGAVSIFNMLSKNKKNRDDYEVADDDGQAD